MLIFDKVAEDRLTMPSIDSFLKVSEAAALLGVSASTIRNWDRSGKVRAMRHPVNNYRLYDRNELQALLERIILNRAESEQKDE